MFCYDRPIETTNWMSSYWAVESTGPNRYSWIVYASDSEIPKIIYWSEKLPGQYTIKLLDSAKPHPLLYGNSTRGNSETRVQTYGTAWSHCPSLGATEWYSGMDVVPKSNGQGRICVDLTNLTRVSTERRLPAVEQILPHLAGATVFTKLDANYYFWQIPFLLESALLTTSLPAFGGYCFHCFLFGIQYVPASNVRVAQRFRQCSVSHGWPVGA